MSKIISVHSFRGGTGKSNTSANLATIYAMKGLRVGVVDTDVQSPGIHILFNMDDSQMVHSLNDYLWGKCVITDTAVDVTNNLKTKWGGKLCHLIGDGSAETADMHLGNRFEIHAKFLGQLPDILARHFCHVGGVWLHSKTILESSF